MVQGRAESLGRKFRERLVEDVQSWLDGAVGICTWELRALHGSRGFRV